MYSVYADCMRIFGVPSRYIVPMCLGNFRSSGGLRTPPFITTSAATICPATVATAAPEIPISGSPSNPKMSSGSSTMFVTAPIICAIIGRRILPSAWWTFVHMLSRNNPKLNTQTILP